MNAWLKAMIDKIVAAIKKWIEEHNTPTPNPNPNPNDPTPPEQSCSCNLTKPVREPPSEVLGGECPVPAGKDIRFLVQSLSQNDVVFFGDFAVQHGAVTISGNSITGNCMHVNGIDYHYKGYRAPTSSGTLHPEKTGQYQTTYRVYYDAH